MNDVQTGRSYPADGLQALHEEISVVLAEWFEQHNIPPAIRDLVDIQGILFATAAAQQEGRLSDLEAGELALVVPRALAILAALQQTN